jgi:hypothetical protein
MKKLTTIPFAGFYSTWHDYELDQALEMMFTDRASGTELNDRLHMEAFDGIAWQGVHIQYAKAYCDAFAEEFEIALTFESLQSPRFYNFETDRVFAEIDLKEVRRLFKETPREIFDAVIEEEFTSRSGFISSYPNTLDEWPVIPEWDHNHIGALIKAHVRHCNNGEDMDQDREFSLMERYRDNGRFDEWLCEAGTPKFNRALRIMDYLEERKER